MTSDEQIDDAIGAFQWRTLDNDGTITTCAAELMVFARAVIAAERENCKSKVLAAARGYDFVPGRPYSKEFDAAHGVLVGVAAAL